MIGIFSLLSKFYLQVGDTIQKEIAEVGEKSQEVVSTSNQFKDIPGITEEKQTMVDETKVNEAFEPANDALSGLRELFGKDNFKFIIKTTNNEYYICFKHIDKLIELKEKYQIKETFWFFYEVFYEISEKFKYMQNASTEQIVTKVNEIINQMDQRLWFNPNEFKKFFLTKIIPEINQEYQDEIFNVLTQLMQN